MYIWRRLGVKSLFVIAYYVKRSAPKFPFYHFAVTVMIILYTAAAILLKSY